MIDDYARELASKYAQGEILRQWTDTCFESYKRRLHDPNLQIEVYDQLLSMEEVGQLQEYANDVYKRITNEIADFVESVKSFDPKCILMTGGGSRAHELKDNVKNVGGVDCYYGLYR